MSVERRKIDSILELQRKRQGQEVLKQALQKMIYDAKDTKEIKNKKENMKQQ